MIITNLELKKFRNYDNLHVQFDKGMNVIIGKNGIGKTNIVEAIYFLSFTRSFRTNEDSEMIMEKEEMSSVTAEFLLGDEIRKINVLFSKVGKKITCNGYEIKKISELAEKINVLVFQPKDAFFFEDSPRVRRRFFDVTLSKMSKSYLEILTRYEKLLEERNNILKQEHPNLTQLEIVTDLLITASLHICTEREKMINYVNPIMEKIIKFIKGEETNIRLHYNPYVPLKDFLRNAKLAFTKALENDIKKKVTTLGAHREDFATLLNDKEISMFGSQGEKRLVALALKLSPYFLVKEKERRPIVVLDDVLSELDERHQKNLLEFLKKLEQVFITATEFTHNDASVYEVSRNKVMRRSLYGTR